MPSQEMFKIKQRNLQEDYEIQPLASKKSSLLKFTMK